ncbi:NAD(P)-binding domain protein [Coniochaeta ligniaria NRRL 30616]|uniref:NAD(P)-binding domain protein n=1 Tax=Coniochaeta ligniaria NRRL 30616 TaxID=1408157 RepID=A0A1J7IU65_9PEZI|nr:NAD(P)-binding domain protein [Coniochaeta ligniaria NRRL 30616]
MSSAIVTGATGILGREIVKQLGKDTQKWKTIHALSRSQKDEYPSNVVHNHIDLTGSVQEMAKDLKDVKAEYVFFAAYLKEDSEQANWETNGKMIENFFSALELTGAVKDLKRIILVTGLKQYGVHLGEVKIPMMESDPWLEGGSWPPNFYYRQQHSLHKFCEKNKHVSWVVTYPNDVIGVAKGAFMNLATSLGLYAAVEKELGRDLEFPGNEAFYNMFDVFTSSKIHAEFCEWAALEPKAANQAFNIHNGDVESWQNLWPHVARRFGMKVKADQFASASAKGLESVNVLTDKPPISVTAAELGLKGKITPSKVANRISLVKWSQQEEVKKAWEKLAGREGLDKTAFEKSPWWFLDFVLGRSYEVVASMSKAREFGWTGYIDTWKSLSDAFGELEAEKILPKTH